MFLKDTLPILGILRGIQREHISAVTDLFIKCDIRYAEITMNTPGAGDLIGLFRETAGKRLVIGAGTVLDRNDLAEAMKAGAEFIVMPSVIEDVILDCVNMKIPCFPGALTPTEVHKAWNSGATMVKLFPGGLFGPGYIKALKGPFDKIRIMAVGGITEQNIGAYFRQGADAVAFGAGIMRNDWIQQNRFDLIEEKLTSLIRAFKTRDAS